MKKLKIFCGSANLFSPDILKRFNNNFECYFYKNLSKKLFEKNFYKYEVLLCRFKHHIPYIKNNKLKYILSPTTGLDHIDKRYFLKKNIKIFHLQGKQKFLEDIHSSSEFTIYMILKLIKINMIKLNNFSKEINSKRVGIIGYGRNGKKISKILRSFGAKIKYFDKNIKNKTTLTSLISNSDIISLNIPLNDKTKKFFDSKKIRLMKKKAILINSSRGDIVDENFLLKNVEKLDLFYASDVPSKKFYMFDKNTIKKYKDRIFFSDHIAGLSSESVFKTDNEIYHDFKKYIKFNQA
jgi:D-3-phosphoglycerate dehydrogenase